MTNVMVVSGSLRKEESNTAYILAPFMEGLKEAGAIVKVAYIKDLKISPCRGDFHCWYTKPGECIIKDDMQQLYPMLRWADILVLSMPVYIPLSGEMQNFLNRFCPLIEPLLEFREGRTRARLHSDVGLKQFVLVSSGGWWEKENMATVVRITEELAKDSSVEFAGALLRPHAYLMPEFKEKAQEVIDAAREAGTQLVTKGQLPQELLDTISQPLLPEEELRLRHNDSYLSAK